ncbi:MAG: alpha/beta fold hydrolase, partial [Cyanobacteria bacterium P01_H01_bin.15]
MIVSPSVDLNSSSALLNGQIQHYIWTHHEQTVTISYEILGTGPKILLLPAFSTVSTRLELAQIAQMLASEFQVIALDWLGFGDSERPAVIYERSLYEKMLADFVQSCCPKLTGILAAGHGAGYALHQAQKSHNMRLLLVAPTWKGPLQAMGAPTWLASGLRNLVRVPIIG